MRAINRAPLTERQKQALRKIYDSIAQEGYPPTIDEIGKMSGVSYGTAQGYVDALEKKGYIERRAGKGRDIVVRVPPEPEPGQDYTDEEIDMLALESGSGDFMRDFRWAYDNLHRDKIGPGEAPSGPALFLWKYGKEAKAKFLDVAIKLFSKKDKGEEEEQKFVDDKRKQFALIDALLEPQKCPHCGKEIPV